MAKENYNDDIIRFSDDAERVNKIFKKAFEKLTHSGRKKVLEDGVELKAEHLLNPQKPEEFTKKNLIEPILRTFNCDLQDGEVQYQVVGQPGKYHYVDLESKYLDICLAIQAKPLNQKLSKKGDPDCAVNQLKDGYKNTSFYKKYNQGAIASDGIRYIIINRMGLVTDNLDVRRDYVKLKKYVTGKEAIPYHRREEISQDFYKSYNELLHGGKNISKYDCFIKSIKNVGTEKEKEEIAQITINRLLFIKFLYERKFIKLQKYGSDFFEYLKGEKTETLNSTLKKLFFNVMNTPKEERVNVDFMFETIPYFNGSLFKQADVEINNSNYIIDSQIIYKTIELLDSYNFAEGEVGKNQIQIDPEILGYIFEKAMTAQDRKGTGAYYTKKSITKYQSKQAIQYKIIEIVNQFLTQERDYHKKDLITEFDEIYSLNETTLIKVREMIENIKICDNACGSGAFIISSANILFKILKKIDYILNTNNTDLHIKKRIVSSLYGVDINPRAIEIAMLRVWLWVAESFEPEYVDEKGERIESTIEPLPNLEYRFMVGNSLIGYDLLDKITFQTVLLDSEVEEIDIKELLTKFVDLKKKYQTTSMSTKKLFPEDKLKDPVYLKQRIEEIRIEMNDKLNNLLYTEFKKEFQNISKKEFLIQYIPFHWALEFHEVFQNTKEEKGFDIIIGNPPYIQLQNKEKIPSHIQKAYEMQKFKTFIKTGDIYCLFYEKSLQLLKKNGILCYITSNKWMRAKYGENLRRLLSEYNTKILLDFSGLQNFKSATVDTNIILLSKEENKNNGIGVIIQGDYNEDAELDIYVNKHMVPLQNLSNESWFIGTPEEISLRNKIKKKGVPLKKWDVVINRGILTGLNEAFIINEAKKEELIGKDLGIIDIIKPILRGRDITKYGYDFAGKYLLFIPWHFPLHKNNKISGASQEAEEEFRKKYPTIYEHLIKHKEKLSTRNKSETGKRYEWYALQRCAATYYEEFEKEKIIWKRIGSVIRFGYSNNTIFCQDSTVIMTGKKLKYLCACMNSKLGKRQLIDNAPKTGTGDLIISVQALEPFIIPTITEKNRHIVNKIEKIVDKIFNSKKGNNKLNTSNLEDQIDLLVYALYDLTYEEIKIIDPDINIIEEEYLNRMKKVV